MLCHVCRFCLEFIRGGSTSFSPYSSHAYLMHDSNGNS
uniref:Uncharacterized protein n=1 Tax=Anguilla anguilla TaxID=7936 RepID=A0A0E9S179_ANGAN